MATLRNAVRTALACIMLASVSIPRASAGDAGEVAFGSQWWTQSVKDAKYQQFLEQPQGGFLETFVMRQWSGRNQFALQGTNGLQSNQSSRAVWTNGVRLRLDLGYQQIPHLFSQTARWAWLQSAPGVFTIPDTLQARNQAIPGSYTQRMQDFLNNAPAVGLAFNTDIRTARARLRPARGWQFEARASDRTRDGLKPYAMSFGFSTALENPEPIDQQMLDVDLIADYHRSRMSFQAIGGVSSFRNDISVLRVDNPKRLTSVVGGDGTAQGAIDLYPDNQVVRGSLALAYELPRRSSLIGTLGLAHGTQDDKFLAFTTNTALPQSNIDSLPARSLNASTNQLTGDVRLRTALLDKVDGTLRFHYTDYQNDTKQLNLIGLSPYEATWERFIELQSHAFTSKQWQAGADVDYDVAPNASVGALAEYRFRERSPREVEKDGETVLGGRATIRAPGAVTLKGDYTRGDRKMDKFLLDEFTGLKERLAVGHTAGLFDSLGLIEQPGLRRYDLANRVQDLANASLVIPAGDRVDLSATYAYLNNKYKSETGADTTLGLRSEQSQTIAANAVLHVSDQLDLNGGLGFGTTKSDQRSRSSAATFAFQPESTWTAKLEDKETFGNAGIDWTPKPRISLSGDYDISRTMTTFDLGNGLNNAADLPNVFYRRQDVTLELGWRWLERTRLVGRYNWEQFDQIDWAVNNVPFIFPVTGTASAIFLGNASRSYTAHRVAIVVRHTF
ncbi:MAG TPA: MtrB/PioB family outer membrane beta-barrel protein [Candidatus Eisenbacteria bacterium]|jgi:MtrB/PioB family decaheme-associated outer membrane protein